MAAGPGCCGLGARGALWPPEALATTLGPGPLWPGRQGRVMAP